MSTRKSPSQSGIPGVSLAALDAIEDENARMVMRAVVDGWNVRNGNAGKPENRFITLNELGAVENLVVGIRGKVTAIEEQSQTLSAAEINRIIADVQGQIMESLLWQELGTRINNIDLAIVAEQQARIAAVQAEANARIASANSLTASINQVAADLVAEATARLNFDNTAGSQILTLQQTTDTQATQITGLQTRTTAAENTIVTLQQTTATQATQISGLTTRTTNAENSIVTLQQTTTSQATALTNLTSRVDTAESNITTLQQTTATQATSITSLTTRMNSAESNITTLQTTTGNQATSITSLTTRMDGAESNISSQGGRLTTAESNITTLQSTTATTATNLTNLTTRVGTAETNIGTLQTTTANQATQLTVISAVANNKAKVFYQAEAPASTASYTLATNDMWLDSDDNNRLYRWNGSAWAESSDARIAANAAAISTETTARINGDNAITSSVTTQFSTVNNNIAALQQADTTITNSVASLSSTVTTLQATVGANTSAIQTEATTRANADNDLYAKYSVKIDQNGYVSGFGLMSTANNAAPSSTFIVRADSFAVGSPSGPGITPKIPFIVLTTTDGLGNPPGVYIDSAVIKNADIGTAKISNLAVTTGKIDDLAVDTLKIAGNAVTQPQVYTAADVYVPTSSAIVMTSSGVNESYNYVGPGNGDYSYQLIYIDPLYGEPVYDYVYVGTGNGDFVRVLTYSEPTFTGAISVIETPTVTVGVDATAAVQIVYYATHDGSIYTYNDSGQHLFMLLDTGAGYRLVAQQQVGLRTDSSADTMASLPIAMTFTARNITTARVKILTGSRRVDLPMGNGSNACWLRNSTISLLGAKR